MSKKANIMDKYLVLRCRNYFGSEVLESLTSGIITGPALSPQGNPIAMGTPCITINEFVDPDECDRTEENGADVPHLDKGLRYNIGQQILVPFGGKNCGIPFAKIDMLAASIRKSPMAGPIDNAIVKESAALDIDKVKRLRDFIHENGNISFILPEKDKKAKNSVEFITLLAASFAYGFEAHTHVPHLENEVISSIEKDELLSVVSFFNIKGVMPIFDTRKCDGVVVVIDHCLRGFIDGKKKFDPTDTIVLIFSNFLENITTVDGMRVNMFSGFGGSTVERLNRVFSRRAMLKAGISMEKQIKTKAKMAMKVDTSAKAEKNEDTISIDSGTSSTNGWGYISSSSSATYYYR